MAIKMDGKQKKGKNNNKKNGGKPDTTLKPPVKQFGNRKGKIKRAKGKSKAGSLYEREFAKAERWLEGVHNLVQTKFEEAIKHIENNKRGAIKSKHLPTLSIALKMINVGFIAKGGRIEMYNEQLHEVEDMLKKLEEDPSRTDIDRKKFAEKMRELLYMAKITDSS